MFQNERYKEAAEHYSRALVRTEGHGGEAARILSNRSAVSRVSIVLVVLPCATASQSN